MSDFKTDHKFKIGDEVYYYDGYKYVKAYVCGLLSKPAYVNEYVITSGRNSSKKKYFKERDLHKQIPVSTRKELYKLIGSEATKIIRRLRDDGFIDIHLPANEHNF